MKTSAEVGAATRKRLVLGAVIAVQVVVPLVALIHRVSTGDLSIPWGWQMFS